MRWLDGKLSSLGALLVLLFTVLAAPAAADTLCANIPITTLPPAPLTNANLQCDTAGNLKVNVTEATGVTPYAGSYGQSLVSTSFLGIGGYDQSASTYDAWTMAPAYTAVAIGQPGIGVVQGIGLNGAVPITGSATILLPISLPTTTPTPQPMPTSAFVGVAGADYTGSVNALKINSAGSAFVVFPSAQPVSISTTVPVSISTTVPVSAATTLPVSIATTVPVSQSNNVCSTGTVTNLAISYASAATTQLVAASGSTKIYVCKFFLMAAGATNVTLETETGGTCSTGTVTPLTGAVPLAAQAGWVEPSGIVPNYTGPASGALCLVNSAAIQVSGSLLYVQQ